MDPVILFTLFIFLNVIAGFGFLYYKIEKRSKEIK